jgi:CRISPR-associated endonuclease/helicase Cas3
MKLNLLETWSKRHQDALPFILPDGWQLATHQWDVYQALNESDIDVVFDTAMTGDGKTLAANLPMLRPQQGWNGVFIYPTNELIRDQQRQASEYQKTFDIELETQLINGAEIARLAAELELGKPDALRYIFQGRPPLLLTNPDIFNLVLNFAYTAKHENPSSMAERFINRYRYFVFDEFHTFDITQVNAVLEAMLFIKASLGEKYKPKYLFLSATPSNLKNELAKAGFQSVVITGQYKHGINQEQGYRKILQASSLEVEPCENSTGGIYGWVEGNLERIRNFYRTYPASKGAIICNSVFAAKRVYSLLKQELANDNIRVGENTGLTGKAARLESLEQDLVVATSTVDVGVDFRINLLIFESLDAGSFIQRLGRLGRHSGFATYQAISLLPKYLCERFEKAFEDGSTVERPVFFESLRNNVFTETQQFASFIPRWGSIKAGVRWRTLYRNKHLQQLYENQANTIYKVNRGAAHRLMQEDQKATYHELTSFRGAGLMDVWIYDSNSSKNLKQKK